jgi:conjugative relaxase-like TrwC/TraI family protein
VLTVTALTDGEYLLSSVALGIDEYYAGVGEAPGVSSGRWSAELGVEGMVEADALRALIDGNHPVTGMPLLVGLRERSVKAFDLTFSAPKSVSLLWALGSEPVADTVMAAHREAVGIALEFLEEHAATARMQVDGVRRHVPTHGWAVAGFVHRTSRGGDPQLHTHCLVPNVVQRDADGRRVALAARPLFVWARAAGSVYQAELQRALAMRLGVEWGPDRSNTRELLGFTTAQLRAFSKRAVEIEAELDARGARYESPALRMRADDAAALATRPAKDHTLTPSLLAGRWHTEADAVGLAVGASLDRRVCWRDPALAPLAYEEITPSLVDEETGLCAHAPRFAEPDVIDHVAALSAGRLTLDEIRDVSPRFLASELVVRLVPPRSVSGWEPARWSTAAHRALEDETIDLLEALQARRGSPVAADTHCASLDIATGLGVDQRHAVRVLCGPGGGVRAVLAPAGYGKTAMVHAAATVAVADGRPVSAVATTAKAVAELAEAGLPASTIARLRLDLQHQPLSPGSVVVLDEVSQTSSRDAHTILAAVAACPGGQLWVLGDAHQAPSVKAGGIAAELEDRVTAGAIPAATLTVNRRQVDPVDRYALNLLRGGDPVASQQLRAGHGWEHEAASPNATRAAMADAVVADILDHGSLATVALVVSHGQAEDLADRIRRRLTAAGVLTGPALAGPGWTTDRHYQTGDRVLFHTRYGDRHSPLVNGTVATITAVHHGGLDVCTDAGIATLVPAEFVRGARADGSPNVSHAWARTVDGAQGGTWDHAHLLGSVALDAYRGYTGQSRARHPTHTWNTSIVDDGDHGGRLADQRTSAEQVAVALARIPDTTMAALDDPRRTDRRLRAAIDTHQVVLDQLPPDRTRQLADARHAHDDARTRLEAAHRRVANTGSALDGLGSLRTLSRAGRAERRQLEEQLLAAQQEAVAAAGVVARAEHRIERLEREQAAHDTFEQTDGWRRSAIGGRSRPARRPLDQRCPRVRGRRPTPRLRARPGPPGPSPPHRAADRHRSRPPTRPPFATTGCSPCPGRCRPRPPPRRARPDDGTRPAHRTVTATMAATRLPRHRRRRRPPRRRSPRTRPCHRRRERGTAPGTRPRHPPSGTPQRPHSHRLAAARARRRHRTRHGRPGSHPRRASPRPRRATEPRAPRAPRARPASPAARAVWCHAAERLETHLDAHGDGGPAWTDLTHGLADTSAFCAVADNYLKLDMPALHPHDWLHIAERARELHDQLAINGDHAAPERQIERGISLDIDF